MKVVELKPSTNIPESLRRIADEIEAGDFGEVEDVTLIIMPDVFHLGPVSDEKAATEAVFNMSYGIHKMMAAIERG